MLTIVVSLEEGFNETSQEFVAVRSHTLRLEHSLVSLSKWESQWEIPFLGDNEKTTEQTQSYIRAMVLDEIVPGGVFEKLNANHYDAINQYINAKMTATWFYDPPGQRAPKREVITSEVVYYWMIALGIPFECENWHLNRLLTLVKVCNMKNAPAKKMGRREQADMQRRLNAERKARLQTKG